MMKMSIHKGSPFGIGVGPDFTGLRVVITKYCLDQEETNASCAAALPSLFFHGDPAIATTWVPRNTSQGILHSSLSVPRL